jgi:uncharacterized protein (DUF2141 family)
MADANIKKLRILKSSLPPIDHDTEKYNIRYRVISEDRNRVSHWSPIYNSDGVDLVVTSGAVSKTGDVITAVWGDQNDFPEYDVFVKFDSGDFFYHGKSKVHSYSFLKTGTTTVRVKVQVISSKKEIKAALNIFDSGTVSLV